MSHLHLVEDAEELAKTDELRQKIEDAKLELKQATTTWQKTALFLKVKALERALVVAEAMEADG